MDFHEPSAILTGVPAGKHPNVSKNAKIVPFAKVDPAANPEIPENIMAIKRAKTRPIKFSKFANFPFIVCKIIWILKLNERAIEPIPSVRLVRVVRILIRPAPAEAIEELSELETS